MQQIQTHQALLFDLAQKSDYEKFVELIESSDQLKLVDSIHSQVEELVLSRNPNINSSDRDKLLNLVLDHYSSIEFDKYGVWAYYPWKRLACRMLPEKEFIELRTNRNKHKITAKEQNLLITKKVGIVGLSVGQSVANTIAIERIAGEIRLADMDDLEVSNLNRLRGSMSDVGINKAILCARQIAEIDPYITVQVYTEGITDHNVDEFLSAEGGIDLLHEECDDAYVKIMVREKAKEKGIPVIMEASDTCTVDIERFDIEPDRPILHGTLEGIDSSMLKDRKDESFRMEVILKMVDIDKLSARVKASIIEMGSSISTWPQLASDVVFGGGVTASLTRKIFLDEFRDSGRYQIDLDDIFEVPNPGSRWEYSALEQSEIDSKLEAFQQLHPDSDSYFHLRECGVLEWAKEMFDIRESNGHLFLFTNYEYTNIQERSQSLMIAGFLSEHFGSNTTEVFPYPVPGYHKLVAVLCSNDLGGKPQTRVWEDEKILEKAFNESVSMANLEQKHLNSIGKDLLHPFGVGQLCPRLNPYLLESFTPIPLRLIHQKGVATYLKNWDLTTGITKIIGAQMGKVKCADVEIELDDTSSINLGRSVALWNDQTTNGCTVALLPWDFDPSSEKTKSHLKILFSEKEAINPRPNEIRELINDQ